MSIYKGSVKKKKNPQYIWECCPLSNRKENCPESSIDGNPYGVLPCRTSPILFSLVACGLLHLVIIQRPKQIDSASKSQALQL